MISVQRYDLNVRSICTETTSATAKLLIIVVKIDDFNIFFMIYALILPKSSVINGKNINFATIYKINNV